MNDDIFWQTQTQNMATKKILPTNLEGYSLGDTYDTNAKLLSLSNLKESHKESLKHSLEKNTPAYITASDFIETVDAYMVTEVNHNIQDSIYLIDFVVTDSNSFNIIKTISESIKTLSDKNYIDIILKDILT